jgi:hypothetical protein
MQINSFQTRFVQNVNRRVQPNQEGQQTKGTIQLMLLMCWTK